MWKKIPQSKQTPQENPPLSYTSRPHDGQGNVSHIMRYVRIELTIPAWHAGTLPLHQYRLLLFYQSKTVLTNCLSLWRQLCSIGITNHLSPRILISLRVIDSLMTICQLRYN